MNKSRNLDPRAQVAIDHLRTNKLDYVGPICPRHLPAALPKRGERRTFQDTVALLLLMELMAVHRIVPGKNPYWRGALYQVDRCALASRFACVPDDVSSALQWLKAVGLAEVVHHTRIDGVGKPCGTEVFAVPRMDRINLILDFYEQQGHAVTVSRLMESNHLERGFYSSTTKVNTALNTASTVLEKSTYLNCAQSQEKIDAESGGEYSPQQQPVKVADDRRIRVAAGGGVAASTRHIAQVPPMPSTVSPGWAPPPIPRAYPSDENAKAVWWKAALFCELWAQALTRMNYATICNPTDSDKKSAFEFFEKCPQTSAYYALAVALNAWWATRREKQGRWDVVHFCRQSFELKTFLRSFFAGKLESEIGQNQKMNVFLDLRTVFTPSELKHYHFLKQPIVAPNPEELWENYVDTPEFYDARKIPMPPEVIEAQKLREKKSP